jgi:hypothetical protein
MVKWMFLISGDGTVETCLSPSLHLLNTINRIRWRKIDESLNDSTNEANMWNFSSFKAFCEQNATEFSRTKTICGLWNSLILRKWQFEGWQEIGAAKTEKEKEKVNGCCRPHIDSSRKAICYSFGCGWMSDFSVEGRGEFVEAGRR